MNVQTLTNVATSPLAKEAGKTVVLAAATTAGMLTGFTAFAAGVTVVNRVKSVKVTTKETPQNES